MASKMEQQEAVSKWLTLKAFEIAVQVQMPALTAANITVIMENLEEGVCKIKTWVLRHQYPVTPMSEEVVVEVPASVWDHFKAEYFPMWLRELFPAKYEKITNVVQWVEGPIYLCPHVNKRLDRDHLQFLLRDGKAEGEA